MRKRIRSLPKEYKELKSRFNKMLDLAKSTTCVWLKDDIKKELKRRLRQIEKILDERHKKEEKAKPSSKKGRSKGSSKHNSSRYRLHDLRDRLSALGSGEGEKEK